MLRVYDKDNKDSKKLTTVREKGKVVDGNVSQEKSDLMKRQIDIEEEIDFEIEQGNFKRVAELEKESEEIDKKLFNLGDSVQPEKKENKLLEFVKGGGLAGMAYRKVFGKDEKKKLRDKDGRYIGDNARKKNFQNMMDKNLYNKASQLPMETTVNPDGSITSEGSGTFIGGELVKPGEPLTPMQRAAMTMGLQMGNTYSPEIMEKYNNAGGSPSKEEFENYQKDKSV